MAFKAFADDTTTVTIHGDDFTITNDPTRIAITGSLEITRDKPGLTVALALQQAISSIVDALRNDVDLPEHVKEEPTAPTGSVKNPFV